MAYFYIKKLVWAFSSEEVNQKLHKFHWKDMSYLYPLLHRLGHNFMFRCRYNCIPEGGAVDCADVDWITTEDVEEGMDDVEGGCGGVEGESEDVNLGMEGVDEGTDDVVGRVEEVEGGT